MGRERLAEYLSNRKEQDADEASLDILVTARRAAKVVSRSRTGLGVGFGLGFGLGLGLGLGLGVRVRVGV